MAYSLECANSHMRSGHKLGKVKGNSMIVYSIISIKRTGLAFFPKFLLNVPYNLIVNPVFLNVLVSIKRTGLTKPNIVLVLNKISNQVDEV